MPVVLLLAAALFVVAGLVLLFVGWRGRRIDDHPHCRRCRYDLSGHEEIAVCPECGRSLARPRALRHGTRRKRRLALVLAGVFLLLSSSGGGVVGWQWARGYDWNRVKPVSWLEREAIGGSVTASDAAHQELLRRLTGDRLSDAQVRRLAVAGLAAQGGALTGWVPAWGEYLEAAVKGDLLTSEQTDLYYRQALESSFSITTRDTIRVGGAYPMLLQYGNASVAESLSPRFPKGEERLWAYTRLLQLEVDGEPIQVERLWFLDTALRLRGGLRTTPVYELDAAPGMHEVRFQCDFAVRRSSDRYGHRLDSLDDLPDLVARWQDEIVIRVEVTESDVVERVPDESLREEIRKTLKPERNKNVTVYTSARVSERQLYTINGTVLAFEPPVNLGFRVFCRHAGVEKEAGLVLFRAGEAVNGMLSEDPRDLFPEAMSVDFILRTDVEAAERTTDVHEIWDGEIVIEDVPIREATEPESAGDE